MKPRRRKTPETSIAAAIRTYARGYAADGQTDFAAGMRQAADIADKMAADGAPASATPFTDRLLAASAPPAGSLEERVSRLERLLAPALAPAQAVAPVRHVPRWLDVWPPPAPPAATKPATAKTLQLAPEARPPVSLGRCELSLIRVLSLRGPLSRTELAIRAGYAVDSGGYSVALATLRARELLSREAGDLKLTPAGLTRAMSENGKASARDVGNVLEYWAGRVGACAQAVLQTLVTAYPETLAREEIARRAGYSAESGGFAVALAKLRRLELVDGCRAHDALMAAIAPASSPAVAPAPRAT